MCRKNIRKLQIVLTHDKNMAGIFPTLFHFYLHFLKFFLKLFLHISECAGSMVPALLHVQEDFQYLQFIASLVNERVL